MAAPTFLTATRLDIGGGFGDLSGSVNVGTDCDGIVCLVRNTTSSETFSSVTIGGQSLTSDTRQQDPQGFAGSYQAWRWTGTAMSGSQSISIDTAGNLGKTEVLVLCYAGVSSIGASNWRDSSGTSVVSNSISSNADSKVASIWTLSQTTLGTMAADSPTVERLAPTAGYTSPHMYAVDRTGGSSVTTSATVSGGTGTLFWWGATWNVQGPSAPPVITGHPSNASVTEPATANFTATATGSTSLQWQVSTNGGSSWNNVSDGTGGTTGTTSGSYTTSATAVSSGNHRNGYQYRCGFTSASGTTYTNAATLTVNAPTGGLKKLPVLLGGGFPSLTGGTT